MRGPIYDLGRRRIQHVRDYGENGMADDPYRDLNYILFRLEKYLVKVAEWQKSGIQDEFRASKIAQYARRISTFIYELNTELFIEPDEVDPFSLRIYDFAPNLERLQKSDSNILRLCTEIKSAIKRCEETLSSFEFSNLAKSKERVDFIDSLAKQEAGLNKTAYFRVKATPHYKSVFLNHLSELNMKQSGWIRAAMEYRLFKEDREAFEKLR